MSIENSNPGIAQENQDALCPFLGLAQDSQTSLSYPSSWNVCHHTKPVGTPTLFFQRSFCFSENHCTCPVYARTAREPLPPGIRLPVKKPPIPKRVVLSILVGAVVLLLGIAGTLWGIQDYSRHAGSLVVITNSVTPSPSATELPLPTATLADTDTQVPPTLTPMTPSPTLLLTSTHTGPATRPTDTQWPSLTPTPTRTPPATRTPTSLPTATATFTSSYPSSTATK